jgi:hypothetical protein
VTRGDWRVSLLYIFMSPHSKIPSSFSILERISFPFFLSSSVVDDESSRMGKGGDRVVVYVLVTPPRVRVCVWCHVARGVCTVHLFVILYKYNVAQQTRDAYIHTCMSAVTRLDANLVYSLYLVPVLVLCLYIRTTRTLLRSYTQPTQGIIWKDRQKMTKQTADIKRLGTCTIVHSLSLFEYMFQFSLFFS